MKKVLFITYYWPPAGGAPINRILKFYQYLHEFGWEPVILTTEGGDFPFEDESLLNEVLPETKIYRSKGFSLHKILKSVSPKSNKNFVPYGFTDNSKSSLMDKVSRWVKYNFIPDTRFPWYYSTVRKAIQIIQEEKIDLIFSSSPPQTNHLIARKASRKTGLPWVADFRDPWTDVFWLLNNSIRWKWIHSIDKRIEKNTINKMDAVVTVGPSLVSILQRKTDKKIRLITNGFDEKYFQNISYKKNTKFRITYAGSMSKEQNPYGFLDALELMKTNEEFFNNVEILFLGNFPGFLHEKVNSSSYKDKTIYLPYTFYIDSLKVITDSELLLMIVPETDDNKCIITSKIFEYIGARRPVLAFGPVDGDAAIIMRDSNAGLLVDYSDSKAAAEFMLQIFKKWENFSEPYVMLSENNERFSRRNLTKQLADVFNQLV